MATNITPTVESFAQESENLTVRANGTSPRVCLTACPACGKDFTDEDGVPLVGQHKSQHLLGHAPEDFGLTPLGGDRDGE